MTLTPELFEGLPESVCDEIFRSAQRRDFAAGKRIFWPGDAIKEVFLLTEGRVKITQMSQDGREIIIRLHVPGHIIGSPTPVSGSEYSSVAQALQPCKTLAWNLAAFERLLARYPQTYSNAHNILECQTAELVDRIFEITEGKVPQRLAYGLLHLRSQIGREVNGLFELDVTQETVAQMTGMTVATANRQLNRWEKQGLVTCFRNTIGIRDHFGLSWFCGNKQLDSLGEPKSLLSAATILEQNEALEERTSPTCDQRTA